MSTFKLTLPHPELRTNHVLRVSIRPRRRLFGSFALPGLFYHLALPNGRVYLCVSPVRTNELNTVESYTVAHAFYSVIQWRQLGFWRCFLAAWRRKDNAPRWLQHDATVFALRNAKYMPRLWLRADNELVAIFPDGTLHRCEKLS